MSTTSTAEPLQRGPFGYIACMRMKPFRPSLHRAAAILSCIVAGVATAQVSRMESVIEGHPDALGLQGDGHSAEFTRSSISANGNLVVFSSEASNLVSDDNNTKADIFLRDRAAGTTQLVSRRQDGASGNGSSHEPAISADGHFVVFASEASDLVAGDNGGHIDVFVFDVSQQLVTRVSVNALGDGANGDSRAPSISGDGDLIAFESAATNFVANDTNFSMSDIFLVDRVLQTVVLASVNSTELQADASSRQARLSVDGSALVFTSDAGNLVSDDVNNQPDVFVRDLQSGVTERISVDSLGVQANAASEVGEPSGDARFVAFQSNATNLVAVDTNGSSDVFLRDRMTSATFRVSRTIGGQESSFPAGGPAISEDGSTIAYYSRLAEDDDDHVFVFGRLTSALSLASVNGAGDPGNRSSAYPSVSADGQVVVFSSTANNLTAVDRNNRVDVFLRDLQAGTTQITSLADAAGPFSSVGQFDADLESRCGNVLSGDGRFVVFASYSANLVVGDDNQVSDVFLHDRTNGETTLVSVSALGALGNAGSRCPSISRDGRFVAFLSQSTNLVPGVSVFEHVFVKDVLEGDIQVASDRADGGAAMGSAVYASISGAGGHVVFQSDAANLVPGDSGGYHDVFVRNLATGTVVRASHATGGGSPSAFSAGPAISADGRWVVYFSAADDIVSGDVNERTDVFLFDGSNGENQMVSLNPVGVPSNGHSSSASVSDDGNRVAFVSNAKDLAGTEAFVDHVYVRDIAAGTIHLVDRASSGVASEGHPTDPRISTDGSGVVFASSGVDLVVGDVNWQTDVFFAPVKGGAIELLSLDADGVQGNRVSELPFLAADGRAVAFLSRSENWRLIAGKNGVNTNDVFVVERNTIFGDGFD